MDAETRRLKILALLQEADAPINATKLARLLSVSRQSIVGDVALLRAKGEDIVATPRGYVLSAVQTTKSHQVVCRHKENQMREELYAIVDNGCTVCDVIVEHAIYGQLTGMLNLSSRYDVDKFIEKIEKNVSSMPISYLTDGIHIHTLQCPDDVHFQRVKEKLAQLHILYQ